MCLIIIDSFDLCSVAAKSDKNLMSASNLAVCFGPTLLRAERETVASILELKFYNVIVETLLDHYHEVSAVFESELPQCFQTECDPPTLTYRAETLTFFS